MLRALMVLVASHWVVDVVDVVDVEVEAVKLAY